MGERHYYFFHFSYSCWVNTRWSRIMFSFEMHQKSCNQAELHCQILFQLETTKILENKCTPRHASQWQNRAYGIFKQQWSLNTHSDWMSAEKKKKRQKSFQWQRKQLGNESWPAVWLRLQTQRPVSLEREKYIPRSTSTSKFGKHKVSLANMLYHRSCSFLSFQLTQATSRRAGMERCPRGVTIYLMTAGLRHHYATFEV